MLEFNNLEEMKIYYNKEINTYVFNDDVTFNFDLIVKAHINAMDINAKDIKADNIIYYGVCFAYNTFKCQSVKGARENSKHFCLDSEIEFIKNEIKHTIIIDGEKIELSEESYKNLKESLGN